ncbi:MAG: hypothetical protein ACHQVK_04575, partial [Candidatus Paceibacterales bacterium]
MYTLGSWHKNPKHAVAIWIIFVLCALVAASFVIASVNDTSDAYLTVVSQYVFTPKVVGALFLEKNVISMT